MLLCGRTDKDVKILITGLNGYICENCARQAYDIAAAQGCYKSADAEGSPFKMKKVPKPREIKAYLDEYIIGQDEAKRHWQFLSTTTISVCSSLLTRMVLR